MLVPFAIKDSGRPWPHSHAFLLELARKVVKAGKHIQPATPVEIRRWPCRGRDVVSCLPLGLAVVDEALVVASPFALRANRPPTPSPHSGGLPFHLDRLLASSSNFI